MVRKGIIMGRKDPILNAPITTTIGSTIKIDGSINADEAMRIDGTVNGDITSSAYVIIGTSGKVTGNIKAAALTSAGTITGNIESAGQTELLETSKIKGDILTTTLITDEHAVFEGNCKMRASE